MFTLAPDLLYVLLIFGIFIVSRFLQRFRIPSAITCIGLGVLFGMGFGVLTESEPVKLMSLLGIVSMFLFAGMEIEFDDLHRGRALLLRHVVIQVILMAIVCAVLLKVLDLEFRATVLVALALLTPSAGFILDSLPGLGMSDEESFWVKSKAIATELIALLALFIAMQSSSVINFSVSLSAMVGMIVLLPLLFRGFAKAVLPYAPRTEFAFLVIVALLCASITKKLGVYYLVGAFVVGLTEQRLRKVLPKLATENLLRAVELFAAFFIPFYFFGAGLALEADNFTLDSLLLALAFLVLSIPLRILSVAIPRRIFLGESLKLSMRVGAALLPTLVFTIVLATILKTSFNASPTLVGALVIYAIGTTTIPGFFLRMPVPQYDAPSFAEAQVTLASKHPP